MEQHSAAGDSTGKAPTTSRETPGGADDAGAPTITLMVNGEVKRCPAGLTLPQLLESLGYRPQLVVVEFNGEILPRARWSEQTVVETDVLEVVTIVGGGS